MLEVFIGICFLSTLWVFGRCFMMVTRAEDRDWLAMPIGLCLVALSSNFLYFMLGLSVQLIQLLFLSALMPSLIFIFSRPISRDEWGRLLAVLGIFLWLALPALIGGEQYGVFRGNHWDNFNYIDQSLTIWANPFPVYQHFLADHLAGKDVFLRGMSLINFRPEIGLIFALCLPGGHGNIHLLAFLYVTALWALVFPAICFAWRQILDAYKLATDDYLLLIGPPLAFVVGFWGQYIFDINAWSQMGSLSLLVAFVFEYMKLLQQLFAPSKTDTKSIRIQYILTGLFAAGAFLFYLENTLLQAGALLLATVLWSIFMRKKPRPMAVVSLIFLSLIVVLISSIPNWKAMEGFAIRQINLSSVQGPNWWRYFDRYWLGVHGNVLFSQLKPSVVHGLSWRVSLHHYWQQVHILPVIGYISLLANLFLGLIGMFFVTPDYSMPFLLRYTWIGLTVTLAMLAFYSLAISLLARYRVNSMSVFLKSFFFSGVLFLMYFLKKGSIWTFGKALTYISPYLFLVICIGFIETYIKMGSNNVLSNAVSDRMIRLFVIVFIVSQIIFGMARLWSARDPNGIGYNNLTYPSIQDTAMKTNYIWNLDAREYAHCQGVELSSTSDPFFMEYLEQKFTYLRLPYFFSLPAQAKPSLAVDCHVIMIKQADQWMAVKR